MSDKERPLHYLRLEDLMEERPLLMGPRVGRPIKFTVLSGAAILMVHWDPVRGPAPHFEDKVTTCQHCARGLSAPRPRGYVAAVIWGKGCVSLVELPPSAIRQVPHLFGPTDRAGRGENWIAKRVGPNANSRVTMERLPDLPPGHLDRLPPPVDPMLFLCSYWGIDVLGTTEIGGGM